MSILQQPSLYRTKKTASNRSCQPFTIYGHLLPGKSTILLCPSLTYYAHLLSVVNISTLLYLSPTCCTYLLPAVSIYTPTSYLLCLSPICCTYLPVVPILYLYLSPPCCTYLQPVVPISSLLYLSPPCCTYLLTVVPISSLLYISPTCCIYLLPVVPISY